MKTVVHILPHGEEKKAVVAKVTKELAPKPAKKATPKAKAPAKKTAAKKIVAKKTK